ncbi:MAG: hypothetical protein H0W84_11690 [Bacteroidetes bacterium]|nr:hypothetical protein [Bacteroidota bacterium]
MKGYKGYISVEIPTKKYIKAFVISQLGEKPLLDRHSKYGRSLYSILESNRNPARLEYSELRYNTSLKIYIPYKTHKNRGCSLNHTNIKDFNLMIEDEIKHRFYELMNHYMEMLPSIEGNLPHVRKKLGIDIDSWSDDSMKKDYYRHRKSTGKPIFYKNIITRYVRLKHNQHFAV